MARSRAHAQERRSGARRLAGRIADVFGEHQLLLYTSAIAFRTLVALIPLSLLGLGLLGVLGLDDVWKDSIAPAIEDRVTKPVYRAIDFSATRVSRAARLA